MQDYKYGILGYNSINIGDEIQSIAAMRFLPNVDYIVYRERFDKFKPNNNNEKVKLIMNAWWMWEPKHFTKNEYIHPLMISMHLVPKIAKKFLNKKNIKYLKENAPIGCRDIKTQKILEEKGIKTYFSKCLTLTLEKNPNIKKQDFVLCIDVPDKFKKIIQSKTDRQVIFLSKEMLPQVDRMTLANLTLWLYQSAHFVISPNLHTILPCLALETPALKISKETDKDEGRYEGYENFYNSINENEFIEQIKKIDFENPKENPKEYLTTKEELIKICSKFTGYNNEKSLIIDKNIEIELFKLLQYNKSFLKRILYFARFGYLLSTIFNKLLNLKQKFDLKQNIYIEKNKNIKTFGGGGKTH